MDLVKHMQEGSTLSEVCAAWGITYSKFSDWLDAYPEFAEAYKVGKPAFDAYYKRALRFVAFGMMPKARDYSLHFLLKNQVGFHDDGGHQEYAHSSAAELVFEDE